MRSKAYEDVYNERLRQIEQEGFGAAHDDQEDPGVLAGGGAAYALNAGCLMHPEAGDPIVEPPHCWLMDAKWWKPNMGDDPRKDLVKAAAFIMAEIEKFDRAHGVHNATSEEYAPYGWRWRSSLFEAWSEIITHRPPATQQEMECSVHLNMEGYETQIVYIKTVPLQTSSLDIDEFADKIIAEDKIILDILAGPGKNPE